jgi:nicotinamide-nucleotide amidase
VLAGLGQVELHLTTQSRDARAAAALLDRGVTALAAALGKDVVSTDGATLEAVVGRLLKARGWWVALAESCTGGLATSRLTDVPGSSEYVERSIVAYSNRAKVELLDVPEELIRQHGAVSEPVAQAMAAGIRKRAGVNIGVGITGIAGPGGGTEQKPVGTVCIAVEGLPPAASAEAGGTSMVRTFRFPGGREVVKGMSANWAIDMLRRYLIEV